MHHRLRSLSQPSIVRLIWAIETHIVGMCLEAVGLKDVEEVVCDRGSQFSCVPAVCDLDVMAPSWEINWPLDKCYESLIWKQQA